MLKAKDGVYCGVFDSRIMRKAQAKSADRNVQCYELELFHTQAGISYINGEGYATRRGMLLCAKPGQLRRSDFPVRCSFIRIPPSLDADVEKLLQLLPDCTYLADDNETEALMALFTRLSACHIGTAESIVNDLCSNYLLMEILYRVSRLCLGDSEHMADAPVSRITREAYEYINENYRGDCSLAMIADAVRISPNHLHTVFVRETGMTPFAYVLKKRIAHAQRFIMAGEKSMLEIALETGFCSQSHFNKAFRAATGTTPVQYRRQLLQQGVDKYDGQT